MIELANIKALFIAHWEAVREKDWASALAFRGTYRRLKFLQMLNQALPVEDAPYFLHDGILALDWRGVGDPTVVNLLSITVNVKTQTISYSILTTQTTGRLTNSHDTLPYTFSELPSTVQSF